MRNKNAQFTMPTEELQFISSFAQVRSISGFFLISISVQNVDVADDVDISDILQQLPVKILDGVGKSSLKCVC